MAVQELKPFVMKNAIIELGAGTPSDFAKAVNSATLTPSGGTVPYKGLKPDAVWTFPLSVTWVLDLSYAQDWSLAASLSRYLFDNIGKIVPASINFDDAVSGTTDWELDVAITAGAAGGAVDAVAVATVSLGVQGAPVPTLIPPAAEFAEFGIVEGGMSASERAYRRMHPEDFQTAAAA